MAADRWGPPLEESLPAAQKVIVAYRKQIHLPPHDALVSKAVKTWTIQSFLFDIQSSPSSTPPVSLRRPGCAVGCVFASQRRLSMRSFRCMNSVSNS